MIEKEQIYNELEFLEIGQMMLLNPNDQLDYPCFFIKERCYNIGKLVNKKDIGFQIRPFKLGNVTAYLILLALSENYEDIYGQWVNKYNKVDRKNYFDLSFKDFINIVFVDEDNIVKYIDTYENFLKGNIKKIFAKEKLEQTWCQKEFELAISSFNNLFESKKHFYEELIRFDQNI